MLFLSLIEEHLGNEFDPIFLVCGGCFLHLGAVTVHSLALQKLLFHGFHEPFSVLPLLILNGLLYLVVFLVGLLVGRVEMIRLVTVRCVL